MSKLEDTLRKDGWKLTYCHRLKLGDYVAVMTGSPVESEGQISRIVENDDESISVFYGECGVKRLPPYTGKLWVAPKEYEHLETRWDRNGTKYINISTNPRLPLFCLGSYITVKHVFNPDNRNVALNSYKDPESLLKEKPVTAEVHDPWANNTPQEQSNNAKE